MSKASAELAAQWSNPGDILSILLLIGGEIVQKAIAQLVGHKISVGRGSRRGLSIAPVAFSFGWAAYAFTNLISAFGSMNLMPEADHRCMVINASSGFVRESRSWVLGRLLRDYEIRSPIDTGLRDKGGKDESIRIDVFVLEPPVAPSRDLLWWSGWITMLLQIGIAAVPWAMYGNWCILLVSLCGILLVTITCAMPQWQQEKWAAKKLRGQKITCLTRGNGYYHIMVLIGLPGSWDVESMATAVSTPRPETRWLSLALAVGWTSLLISMSGLKSHTWFLIGIGGLGMLHNVFAAGAMREPGASNLHMRPFEGAPTIIGRREYSTDDTTADVNLHEQDEELADVQQWISGNTVNGQLPRKPQWISTMSREDGVPAWLETVKASRSSGSSEKKPVADGHGKMGVIYTTDGVQGALTELEKWVPTAGLAMLQIFFPGGLAYNDASVRYNLQKKFWKRAFYTVSTRKKAEEKRRADEVRDPNP